MKSLSRITAHGTLVVLLAVGAAFWSPLGATNLTGMFKNPDGTPVDGKLIFLLSQPARLNDGSAQVVPMVKIFIVTNGQLAPGAFVYGNDVLLPSGTYYLVRLVDNSNNLLFEQKWSIQGTNLDLGTLTPTTTGVVVPDPLLKNITGDQAVQGPVTFSSPLTAVSLILNGNLNPGSPSSYDLGTSALPWNQTTTDNLIARKSPWFDVRAYGAKGDNLTNDTAAFQSAITNCIDIGGGTVFVPVQAAGTVYRVPGPLTFTTPATGWCRLLIEGDIWQADVNDANGNGWSIPQRWVIEGLGNKFSGQGTFAYDPMANISSGTTASATDMITVTGGPAVLKNLKVVVRAGGGRHGINIDPTSGVSHFKLENVNVARSGSQAGSPLRISGVQWATVRDSSFIQSATGTDPSVEITTAANPSGIFHFVNVVTAGRTIKLTGTPTSAETGVVIFENIIYENGSDEGMFTVDTKPGANGIAWRGLSFLDVQCADSLLPGGCALLKSSPTNDGGLIEGVVVRNPAYFAQGIFKPAAIGPQKINGLIVEGIQNSSGAMPIGQFDEYLAVYKGQNRMGTTGVESTFKVLMPRPSNVVATGFTTGGTLAAGNYYYVVTALDPDGNQTYISDEKTCNVASGSTGRCDLAWTAVGGASSYRIYGRGLATYYSAQNKANYGTSTTASFSDAGSLPNSGSPPTLLNTPAAGFKLNSSGSSWIKNGNNFGIGTGSPGAPLDVVGKIRTDNQYESTVATGTAPLVVASATRVNNLNAQKWEGKDAFDFSASLDFGSIAAQTCAELTIGVTGAATNNPVAPAWPAGLEAGLAGLMRVSAADVVTVRLCNVTASAIDPASQAFAGRVIR